MNKYLKYNVNTKNLLIYYIILVYLKQVITVKSTKINEQNMCRYTIRTITTKLSANLYTDK